MVLLPFGQLNNLTVTLYDNNCEWRLNYGLPGPLEIYVFRFQVTAWLITVKLVVWIRLLYGILFDIKETISEISETSSVLPIRLIFPC